MKHQVNNMSSTQHDSDHHSIIKARQSMHAIVEEGHGTLGTWGTVFAIMSTIVGGGLVSIPWAFG
jgi:hypothetical protein